jgi:DNA polymerase-1
MSSSKGVSTGAVRGVASMLLRDLRKQKPTHIAFCMDLDSKVKRAELYADYKANRPPAPEDLKSQMSLVKDVVRAMNIPLLEVSGYEADDIIATLAKEARAKGFDVVIVSGDKDLMQLVADGQCRFYDGMKDAWFDEAAVLEKWGVPPKLVGDLLSLTGDTVDNVPGVPGVGPKTAAQLLTEFGDLNTLLARAGEIKRPKTREAVVAHLDQIKLARKLIDLDESVELGLTIEDLAAKPIEVEKARPLFAELEMFSLLKELPGAAAASAATGSATAEAPPPVAEVKPFNVDVSIVRDTNALDEMVKTLQGAPRFAVQLFLTSDRPLVDASIGWAFGLNEKAWYVPVGIGSIEQAVLREKVVIDRVKPLLESETILKDGHSMKALATALRGRGVKLAGIGVDVELASFLVNASRREHALIDLAREKLNAELPAAPIDSRKRPALAQALPEDASKYTGGSVLAIERLAPIFVEELERAGAKKIYEEIERPLMPVLAEMESLGIRIDVEALRSQGSAIEKELSRELTEIHQLAGREFNVNAPAQLAEVLFEHLGLPVIKRGKTGPSTDAEVLEKLAEQHPLPNKVLEYRGLSKLKSTYLDTLPELVAEDGRVHTTFNQLGAATGRLSSNDPNLQNIPIRTEVGKRIRTAFVSDSGMELVSADYSQIELRILAHVSGDSSLQESFAKGEDVHTRTAAEIYSVPAAEVQGEMRRVAKMINYAIAYGLSAHGLSTRIGIDHAEAKRVIEAYFERYAGVKAWLDSVLERGRKQGYVETILGRRRQLADLTSRNPALRQAAERAAVNAPIQGTAADIVKTAMLRVDAALKQELPEARMLLQVHDELLFEVKKEHVNDLITLVRPLMENAVPLSVPVVVDVGHGHSWAEAH